MFHNSGPFEYYVVTTETRECENALCDDSIVRTQQYGKCSRIPVGFLFLNFNDTSLAITKRLICF